MKKIILILLLLFLIILISCKLVEWKIWFDETKVLAPGESYYLGGEAYGVTKTVKYSIESTGKIDIYWAKSDADFKLISKGGEFSYYTQCSTQSITNYNSPECRVNGDSGLAIINRANSENKVKIIIKHKY